MAHASGWVVWSHQRSVSGRYWGADALSHVLQKRFRCALRHGGHWGGVIEVVECAGEQLLEGVVAVLPLSPACFARPPHRRQSFCRAGSDHQVRSPGAEREGSGLGVRERRWRGRGAGDACRRCGQQEARGRACRLCGEENADKGQGWPALWRPWEREWQERDLEDLWQRLGEQLVRVGSRGGRHAVA